MYTQVGNCTFVTDHSKLRAALFLASTNSLKVQLYLEFMINSHIIVMFAYAKNVLKISSTCMHFIVQCS